MASPLYTGFQAVELWNHSTYKNINMTCTQTCNTFYHAAIKRGKPIKQHNSYHQPPTTCTAGLQCWHKKKEYKQQSQQGSCWGAMALGLTQPDVPQKNKNVRLFPSPQLWSKDAAKSWWSRAVSPWKLMGAKEVKQAVMAITVTLTRGYLHAGHPFSSFLCKRTHFCKDQIFADYTVTVSHEIKVLWTGITGDIAGTSIYVKPRN